MEERIVIQSWVPGRQRVGRTPVEGVILREIRTALDVRTHVHPDGAPGKGKRRESDNRQPSYVSHERIPHYEPSIADRRVRARSATSQLRERPRDRVQRRYRQMTQSKGRTGRRGGRPTQDLRWTFPTGREKLSVAPERGGNAGYSSDPSGLDHRGSSGSRRFKGSPRQRRAIDDCVRIVLRPVAQRTGVAGERLAIEPQDGATAARAAKAPVREDRTNGHHEHDQSDTDNAQQHHTHGSWLRAPLILPVTASSVRRNAAWRAG